MVQGVHRPRHRHGHARGARRPQLGQPGKGRKLGPGQTYAVEPMLCLGSARTELLDDQWTVVTADGGLAAHTEHTIAITDDGPEILTRP